jgi:UDP-2,4-diacetamido-2,4,6-trideoxy-beta-L-altropyranose hydrolase
MATLRYATYNCIYLEEKCAVPPPTYFTINSCVSMNMQDRLIIFRTVAGGDIGFGHLIRCLSLAQAVQAIGAQTCFLLSGAGEPVVELVKAAGADLVESPKGVSLQDDLAGLVSLIDERNAAAVVLDGYQFDQAYLDGLSEKCACLYLDDLQELVPTSRLVLNQNPEASVDDYPTRQGQVLLFGLEHALLRPEFIRKRLESPRQNPKIASRLLVTFGGADPNALCARAILGLAASKNKYEIKVIAGELPGPLAAAQAAALESPYQVELLTRVEDMASLMAWADLALCGSGVTGYEMCCLGLPMVVVTPVSNQIPISDGLDKAGLIRHLGWWEDIDGHAMARAVDNLAMDFQARNTLSLAAQNAVDGLGAERVAKAILEEAETWPN